MNNHTETRKICPVMTAGGNRQMRSKLTTLRKQQKEARHLMDAIEENERYSGKLLQLNELLRDQLEKTVKDYKEAAAWVKDIEDPEIRDILILYYIQGKTHEQVARELGYTRLTVLRKINRFWEKQGA